MKIVIGYRLLVTGISFVSGAQGDQDREQSLRILCSFLLGRQQRN
jgi:hypothetical protein